MEVLPFTFHGTVYVLDDDDGVRDSITLLLGCEGFRVTAFASGVEFLRRTMAWFGCVLTDLHMPGMSGIELIEEIRRRDAHIPLIVMTGLPTSAIYEAVDTAQARLLVKPFAARELVASVTQALRRHLH
jgi:two-component system, LuxR family, response regulator FixJ